MAVSNLTDPILITNTDDLRKLAALLLEKPIVAVDTESNSLFAYQEQVCLIQFSTTERDYLVDPLAMRDLGPLGSLFSSPKVEKVFHAAEYDLICLKRDYGFQFENIFDTMVAARILGCEEVGLGAILDNHFQVKINKRYQRADWGKRPLPRDLLLYAQLDTHYLIVLREQLQAELAQKGLLPLAREDFRRLCAINGKNHDNKDGCWRITGAHDLTPQKAAVLSELCRYRDQVARQMNRPLFKVLGDQVLAEIALRSPRSLEEMEGIPGLPQRQRERHGSALLAAVGRGLKAEPIYQNRCKRPNDQYLERLENLRIWRKAAANRMGVKSDVILPRDLMMTIAEKNPQHPEDLTDILKEFPWRLEHFGDQILSALQARGIYRKRTPAHKS